MNQLAPGEIAQFRDLVERTLGLDFGQDASDQLAIVLSNRLKRSGCSELAAYLQRLCSPEHGPGEQRHLAAELTVPETYFFRHAEQYEAFAQVAMPQRLQAAGSWRPVRILSAGCASGEEAYSLAAVANDYLGTGVATRFEILGVDVNAALLQKARHGHYSEWSLRATSGLLRRRHFHPHGRQVAVSEALRSTVKFEERNLLADDEEFWSYGAFDIVFCRNVMIYFGPETVRRMVARIAHALRPGGYLFLGPSETLRGVSSEFHLCHTHGAFYYERRADGDSTRKHDTTEHHSRRVLLPRETPPTTRADTSWFGAIGHASDRIAALAERAKAQPQPSTPPVIPVEPQVAAKACRRWDLRAAKDLLRRERFADALDTLRAMPPESRSDPDVLILQAVVLTNGGHIADAEETCLRVLAIDRMNAGAHYLRALCREQADDVPNAVEHDQTAIYLDPTFAMPRLHLGLMAARAGDRATAERELRHALTLLPREDHSRLSLFGGGFGRESLSQLCRTQLRALGVMA